MCKVLSLACITVRKLLAAVPHTTTQIHWEICMRKCVSEGAELDPSKCPTEGNDRLRSSHYQRVKMLMFHYTQSKISTSRRRRNMSKGGINAYISLYFERNINFPAAPPGDQGVWAEPGPLGPQWACFWGLVKTCSAYIPHTFRIQSAYKLR